MRYYDIEVAGTKRALKLCPINQDLCIAAFLILGDTELTVNCAAALLERAPFNCRSQEHSSGSGNGPSER